MGFYSDFIVIQWDVNGIYPLVMSIAYGFIWFIGMIMV